VSGDPEAKPVDLLAITSWTGAVWLAAYLPVVSTSPIRVVVGLPFVLFAPGYALVAALFPESGTNEITDGSVDGIERIVLSVGGSFVLVPATGLLVSFTPFGLRLLPLLVGITLVTLTLVAIGVVRRRRLPPEQRFRTPVGQWRRTVWQELVSPDDGVDRLLNVVLALAVITATASVGYAVAVPQQADPFTEMYLLTADGDGEGVAGEYPSNLTAGNTTSLVLGIGNREQSTVNYTVVVELQRVRNDSVQEAERLGHLQTRLSANESNERTVSIHPTLTGQRMRLVFMLYRGSPPADPSLESAYREVHLWVNVSG
jgi:uncharacterized membrane protein